MLRRAVVVMTLLLGVSFMESSMSRSSWASMSAIEQSKIHGGMCYWVATMNCGQIPRDCDQIACANMPGIGWVCPGGSVVSGIDIPPNFFATVDKCVIQSTGLTDCNAIGTTDCGVKTITCRQGLFCAPHFLTGAMVCTNAGSVPQASTDIESPTGDECDIY